MGVDLVVFVGLVPDIIIIALQALSNFPNRLPVLVEKFPFFAIKLLRSRPPLATVEWVQEILGIKKQLRVVFRFFFMLWSVWQRIDQCVASKKAFLLLVAQLVVLESLLHFL